MGIFGRFEKKVEGAVNGVFARAFKGDVQPVEIAARLQRELDAEAKLMSRDKRLVPNDFTVGLSPHDHDKLAPYSSTLTTELAAELRHHASEMGYQFNGPIRIHLALVPALPTGRFTVESEAVAGVEERGAPTGPPAHPAARAPAARRPGPAPAARPRGQRHPARPDPPGLVIGRGTEADLRINDPGISRRHAEIQVEGVGASQRLHIVDLGSTNGIVVNGHRVREAALQEGSRIEIGSTRMLVHAPAGR
ncbi:FHA domain-containing protein [Friedmanniella luteola]|uniref:FHA domain-containing protein n=1 Tax=Friedmanniella luteola TaxID=546871 RepID=A0A1H2ADW8_9ACTN|nr:DUF3662 and FHA domain-containing protein [Friedmanniella luteola]SDT44148.1 FHA domain-containing protein [Friedmanniella luteola]